MHTCARIYMASTFRHVFRRFTSWTFLFLSHLLTVYPYRTRVGHMHFCRLIAACALPHGLVPRLETTCARHSSCACVCLVILPAACCRLLCSQTNLHILYKTSDHSSQVVPLLPHRACISRGRNSGSWLSWTVSIYEVSKFACNSYICVAFVGVRAHMNISCACCLHASG